MLLLYERLRRLPASTDAWSCPWFRMILWFAACTMLAGAFANTSFSFVIAAIAALLAANVFSRRRKGISCS